MVRSEEPPILIAKRLEKRYRMGGEVLEVLRGADLDICCGQWLAVIGASGSGKSTLLHLLGGLDRPDGGSVNFDGRDIFAYPSRIIDRYRNTQVGFVFQSYHLLPELSALENVLIAAMIGRPAARWPLVRSKVRRRAMDLLEGVGLVGRHRHRPAKLSGGERQRVAIARALINEPAVLLADEPTGNLDAHTGRQILDLLRKLHAAGQTIVMVTHDPVVAEAADWSLKLEGGQLKRVQADQTHDPAVA